MRIFPLFLVLSVILFSACGGDGGSTGESSKPAADPYADFQTTSSGLRYKILTNGDGPQASAGSTVKVHYTGKLENGNKFDSSYDRNDPIQFVLGNGMVIRGWDEGIALLKVGDKATFVIPPALGYGDRAIGDLIPANSTLIFDVELVEVL